ncbi:Germline survival defective-1 [Caenorhabditis elegans]|uniref:Germline survival defective-1 n=2 Tax=Caenorhabditis elegans TaxID=6239 RepID=GLS1_CAEEL|nr:Germline survival defective-1 [Caenorhabditis elegans]Q8I4M5.2 RecName: Full=Germline survival defective-1; Flags: Precursor [Caenorhabditis elegans]CAD56562.2 Germline survival defective-1 [Caenorhabditis elegans]|eukprot:NP_871882.2 Germline survival defective-1 [Caenorhabditis elegans]
MRCLISYLFHSFLIFLKFIRSDVTALTLQEKRKKSRLTGILMKSMANKKNHQQKKSTDGSTMNGNNATATAAATTQNSSQIGQNSNSSHSVTNDNTSSNNASTSTSSITSTTTTTTTVPSSQQSQSQNQYSHQRLSSTSSTSQQTGISKFPAKKAGHNELEKTSNTANSQSGAFKGTTNKDRPKEKEKNTHSGNRQSQVNHNHHHSNHVSGNQQNRKNKNRDHSNQSYRGGYTHNHNNYHSLENAKSSGFLSNSSLSSAGQISASSAPPVSTTPTAIPIFQESKIVQTDPPVEEAKKKKEKPKIKRDEEPMPYKSTDPKNMDSVMAFKEHDEWDKVEFMCELVSFLSPTDLRLLGNCIEGSVRCYNNQMRPVEKTSNCSDPTAGLPQFVCSPPPPPQQVYYFPGIADAALYQTRNAVNSVFVQQHPPGLPPLLGGMQNIMYPPDANFHHSTSCTTPSSSVSVANKDVNNVPVVLSSSVNGISNNIPSDRQQLDSKPNTARGSSGNINQSNTTSPEPEPGSNHISTTAANPAHPTSVTVPQSVPPVPQEPELFLKSVLDLTSYIYTLMAVCSSTNRKSAAKISDYVQNVILREKSQILERIPDELDKITVLQEIGKIVAAMTHHPAITLDDKMKYAALRDGLRAQIETLFRQYYTTQKQLEQSNLVVPSSQAVGDENDTDSDHESEEEFEPLSGVMGSRFESNPVQPSPSVPGTFFIIRFIGRQIEKNDNLFSLEIHWSDGDRTFAQRSRDQLKALQHRLLDEFGQQRSEKYLHQGCTTSYSSFDDDNKKLSASTSTMETFAPNGERIVPRLARDATPAQYVQYINELSDLPARMMLSAVICEEFNGTRAKTEDLLQETREASDGLIYSRWKNPRAKSPVRYFKRNATGSIDPIELPVNMQPFLYSNIPQTQVQTLFPSCSNCGGPHAPKHCEKQTLLSKKGDHRTRSDGEGSQQNGGTSSSNSYAPIHANLPHAVYIENPQAMLGSNHFNHHQQQHIIQNTIFHNGGQFRANGTYEPQIPIAYYHAQGTVQNSNNTGGVNGNSGGGNQNSNF